MKLTQEQYREIYLKLPDEIKDVAVSSDVNQTIYNICEKHKLHIDEAGKVYNVTMDVVMGIIATKNFESEIVREIKINPLEASAIVRDIDNQVLTPIKETMIRIYKHSNPFKPQTMQHADEYDEEDETKLDRNNLLAEIENPQKSEVRKISSGDNLPMIKISDSVTKEKILEAKVEEKTKVAKDPLQQIRERMLKTITEEKLASIVTMGKQSVSTNTAKPSESKMGEAVNEESKTEKETLSISTNKIENKTMDNTPSLPETKLAFDALQNATPVISPTQNTPVDKPAIDPYREAIE